MTFVKSESFIQQELNVPGTVLGTEDTAPKSKQTNKIFMGSICSSWDRKMGRVERSKEVTQSPPSFLQTQSPSPTFPLFPRAYPSASNCQWSDFLISILNLPFFPIPPTLPSARSLPSVASVTRLAPQQSHLSPSLNNHWVPFSTFLIWKKFYSDFKPQLKCSSSMESCLENFSLTGRHGQN